MYRNTFVTQNSPSHIVTEYHNHQQSTDLEPRFLYGDAIYADGQFDFGNLLAFGLANLFVEFHLADRAFDNRINELIYK